MTSPSLPRVVVVGSQELADALAVAGASWEVLPAASDLDALWAGIEDGSFPAAPEVLLIADGTAPQGDVELAMNLATFAPHSRVGAIAMPGRVEGLVEAAYSYSDANGLGQHFIAALPGDSMPAMLDALRTATADLVAWTAPAAPAVPVEAPAVDPTTTAGYEQDSFYGADVAQALRAGVVKPAGARPGQTTIAVMSSKGGSGKSTSAICLAGMIAKATAGAGEPKSVVLVDLDTRDGQVGSLIAQYMPTAVNIRLMDEITPETVRANLVHDKRLGIDALLAPVRPRNADDVGPEFYAQVIQVLQTTHDVVILDCSVNYLEGLLGTAFALSDEILFVTTLATTSVQGMARALTEMTADPAQGGLGIPKEKIGIVANQVIKNVGMDRTKLLRAALGAELLGQIPAEHDQVLVQTNANRMDLLLKHPRLGPAYLRLAQRCLPHMAMADLFPAPAPAAAAPAAPAAGTAGSEDAKRKGLWGR